MNRIKDNTMNFIIDEATKLFLEKSIVSVTMSEIAKQVGIGEATLYRYFQKKQNIVMQASVKLAKNVVAEYFTTKSEMNGYETLTGFYSVYELLLTNHPEYFKFINELDAYIITDCVAEKTEYETNVNVYKEIFDKAYAKGLEDKSIKALPDPDGFYYSTTHALLNLCKFLSSKEVLAHDQNLDRTKEVSILADIILNAVKA